MVNGCGYTVDQYPPVATTTGYRKHLNYLLLDKSQENAKMYGLDYSQTYSFVLSKRRAQTAPATTRSLQGLGDISVDTVSADVEARNMATQVGGRRGPAGQFFTEINGSLFEKEKLPSTYEGANITQNAYQTMRASTAIGAPRQHTPTSPSGPAAAAGGQMSPTGGSGRLPPVVQPGQGQHYQGGATASGGSPRGTVAARTAAGQPSWILPWQTGDRVTGRSMALSIRNKRTPIGGFAVLDLPKGK